MSIAEHFNVWRRRLLLAWNRYPVDILRRLNWGLSG